MRNYAIIQGVMDILEKRGYQLKAADKVRVCATNVGRQTAR